MYRDGDMVINPDFQRLFRWDIERKSRLIESILVRIPLPSIFVFELPNSRWEVMGCSAYRQSWNLWANLRIQTLKDLQNLGRLWERNTCHL